MWTLSRAVCGTHRFARNIFQEQGLAGIVDHSRVVVAAANSNSGTGELNAAGILAKGTPKQVQSLLAMVTREVQKWDSPVKSRTASAQPSDFKIAIVAVPLEKSKAR